MFAPRDKNHVPTKLGLLYTDGVTLVPIAVDGSGDMLVNASDTIGFTPVTDAFLDENHEAMLLAVDSTDPTKVCPIYVDATGAVLVGT